MASRGGLVYRVGWALPTFGKRWAVPTLFIKHLQPIIPRVHCDDAVAFVDGDAPGIGKFARFSSRAAPDGQARAGLLVDLLHAVVAKLADDQVAIFGHV